MSNTSLHTIKSFWKNLKLLYCHFNVEVFENPFVLLIEGGDCRADDHATEQITNGCIKRLSGFSSVYEIGLEWSRALQLYSSQLTYKYRCLDL